MNAAKITTKITRSPALVSSEVLPAIPALLPLLRKPANKLILDLWLYLLQVAPELVECPHLL
jgi:hypothetical protein